MADPACRGELRNCLRPEPFEMAERRGLICRQQIDRPSCANEFTYGDSKLFAEVSTFRHLKSLTR